MAEIEVKAPEATSSAFDELYQNLDESRLEIRLLELHPGNRADPVSGDLITVSLPRLPLAFDHNIYLVELETIQQSIDVAIERGGSFSEVELQRWVSLHASLDWLCRYRIYMLYRCLLDPLLPADTLMSNLDCLATRLVVRLQELIHELTTILTNHPVGIVEPQSFEVIESITRDTHQTSVLAKQVADAVEMNRSGDRGLQGALASQDFAKLRDFASEFLSDFVPSAFYAVSWFWGDATVTEDMYVDGVSVPAPSNAVHALRDIRDRHELQRIWIDAVCINQQDDTERASQILLMSDIYSSALKTFIWLGHAYDNCEATMAAMRTMATLSKDQRQMNLSSTHAAFERCFDALEPLVADYTNAISKTHSSDFEQHLADFIGGLSRFFEHA